jgi:LPXTG-site transpeptidase (sortase) family protein
MSRLRMPEERGILGRLKALPGGIAAKVRGLRFSTSLRRPSLRRPRTGLGLPRFSITLPRITWPSWPGRLFSRIHMPRFVAGPLGAAGRFFARLGRPLAPVFRPVGRFFRRLTAPLVPVFDRLGGPRRLFLVAGPLAAAVAFVVVLAFFVIGGGGSGTSQQVNAKLTPTAESGGLLQEGMDKQAPIQPNDLQARNTNEGIANDNPTGPAPGTASGDLLIIPSINVNAPITQSVVTVDENGIAQMAKPGGPTDVVWYDFSAIPGLGGRPGAGGNTVISGHVDYHDYGPAVFWSLGDLEPNAEITVRLGGKDYKYSVVFNRVVDPNAALWNEVVSSTSQESLTMITCTGDFDPSTRSYNMRRVVWAVRVQ